LAVFRQCGRRRVDATIDTLTVLRGARPDTERRISMPGSTDNFEAMIYQRVADLPAVDPLGTGAAVRIVAGARLQMLHQLVPEGAGVPDHSHDNEQLTYVISGSIRARVEDEETVLKAGDALIVAGGVTHSTKVLADAEVIEIFNPPRRELEG
jgi:quercetin dioxygenase-like cupin family protein